MENNQSKLIKEFQTYQQKLEVYKQIKKDYDLKLHQQSLLNDQLAKSSYARVSIIYI